MPVRQHCNYAGPLGTLFPTRSPAYPWRLLARLRRRGPYGKPAPPVTPYTWPVV